MKRFSCVIFFGILCFIFSCAENLPTTNVENPYAVGGDDQSVVLGESVVLDGTGSYDLKNRSLEYSWTFTLVPPVTGSALNNNDLDSLNSEKSIVEFTPDVAGNYGLALTVTTNKGTDVDYVVVVVTSS